MYFQKGQRLKNKRTRQESLHSRLKFETWSLSVSNPLFTTQLSCYPFLTLENWYLINNATLVASVTYFETTNIENNLEILGGPKGFTGRNVARYYAVHRNQSVVKLESVGHVFDCIRRQQQPSCAFVPHHQTVDDAQSSDRQTHTHILRLIWWMSCHYWRRK